MDASQFCQMETNLQYVHMEGDFFYQGCNKREDKDVMWENISEEDPTPWIDVQDKPFTRSRK